MDIHKPKAAHSLREFVIEIATITVGILIALSLEALVQAHHDHEMVEHARADLRKELTANRTALASTIAQQKMALVALDSFVRYGRARLKGKREPFPPNFSFGIDLIPMNTAAWESTSASQALAHMPYEEAHRLAKAYAGSRSYDVYQVEAATHLYELASLPEDLDTLSGDDLKSAVHEVALNRAHEASLLRSGEGLLKIYDEALADLR